MLHTATARRLFDATLAALIGAVGIVEIWLPLPSVMGDGSKVVSSLVVLVVCLALAFRRVWPLPVAVVALLGLPVVYLSGSLLVMFWGQFVPMAVAVFSVARYGRERQPLYGAVAAAATLLFIDLRIDLLSNPSEIVFHWLVFTIAWSFGYGLSAFDRKATRSMQRVLDVEIEAAERAAAAVTEERTRIARELHDVVAHSVSVMVVQAGAAQQMVDDDPEYVRAALDTIRTTGTEALSEMRRVVEMLREQDESGALAPQPGAASVSALVEDARVGGLDVSLLVEGEPRQLPAGLDLAVYRIVQEALTNVRRHAAASTASVVLRYGSDDVVLEVRDDGAGVPSSPEVAGGHGLVGMRERAALYGGHLETVSGNGFTVRAVLPVAPA